MLQDLIKYGGRSEVEKVIIELKARIPRHPVYIVVFAFCEKTKNPDSVWKSGFYCLFFFKVVPPEIEPFASAYSNSLSDCTFITLSFMKAIELASH